jgi:hypothetical protein
MGRVHVADCRYVNTAFQGTAMSISTPPAAADEIDEILGQSLAQAVPDLVRCPAAIAGSQWARFRLSTSYDTYLVTVWLDDGKELQVFVKDFGVSVRPKDKRRQRREREPRVYQELLGGTGLGTARYYGSVVDETQGRHWLLLEFVDGTPVGYCDLEHWPVAAEALGRMHGYFARQVDRLEGCEFLVRHDAEFFWSKAEKALENVERISPRRVCPLARLVSRYGVVIAAMTGQPPTLLHGGCRPSNILVKVSPDPSRVCILDWEEAALGAPLLDLAHLLDGVESPVLDWSFTAYRRGAADHGLILPPAEDMRYLFDCFRLHMTLNSLSHAVFKGYKEQDIIKLLGIAERIGGAVLRRVW